MTSRPAIALLVASLGWGLAGVGSRYVLIEGASTFTVVVVRTVVAAIGAAVVFGARASADPVAWRRGALIGVIQIGIAPSLFVASLNYISAGVEGLVITIIPVTTAVLAALTLGERLTARRIAGLLLGLAGTTLLVVSGESGIAEGGNVVRGGAFALAGVVAASIAAVLARRFAPDHGTPELALPMFGAGAVTVAVFGAIGGSMDVGGLPPTSWLVLCALGLGSTLLPFASSLYASRHVAAATVTLTAYVAPLIGVVAGAVLLDEVITLPIVAGGAVVLAGVALASRSSTSRMAAAG